MDAVDYLAVDGIAMATDGCYRFSMFPNQYAQILMEEKIITRKAQFMASKRQMFGIHGQITANCYLLNQEDREKNLKGTLALRESRQGNLWNTLAERIIMHKKQVIHAQPAVKMEL